MTTSVGERLAIWGSLGMALIAFAGAGALHVTELRHAPPAAPPAIVVNVPAQAPPNVIVQAPKPYVCTPGQAEAGECLPLVNKPDLFSATNGRRVTAIDVQMTRTPKPKPKKKSAKKKLQSDWTRAQSFFPQLFNMER